jgi:predicted MFS family arabinose efflux permease
LNEVGQAATWAASTATAVGLLHAARAAGTGIGPIAWRSTVERRWPAAPYEITTITGVAGIACFILSDHPVAIVLSIVLWGVGTGSNWVITATRVQQLSPDEYRGRLSSIDFFGLAVGLSTGAWTSAVIGERYGATVGAAALAAACLVSATIVRLMLPGSAAKGPGGDPSD